MDSKLLYISRYVIVISLTKIFDISARLTPIYNGKNSKDDCGNYRPISVIYHFIEKIL